MSWHALVMPTMLRGPLPKRVAVVVASIATLALGGCASSDGLTLNTQPPTTQAPATIATSTTEMPDVSTTAVVPTTMTIPVTVRTPQSALVSPPGVAPCVGSQLQLASGSGLFFIRFFNAGDPCGLAGVPVVRGRADDGTWHTLPTIMDPGPVTTGPRWTGVFTRDLTAVVSLRATSCANANARRFSRVELETPAGTVLAVPLELDWNGCRISVTPFEADHQGP
jgi:hypothetical protein